MTTDDFDRVPPGFYDRRILVARKEHRCSECGMRIFPGETYERVCGTWERQLVTFKTCCFCFDLREWVEAKVARFAWAHGSLLEDAVETAQGNAHLVPGILFGTYRRVLAINRTKRLRDALEVPGG